MHDQTVETVMTTNVLSVHPSTPVVGVSALLIHHKISAVPVLDTDGRPLGVVSEEDILAAAAHPAPVTTAANLMNRPALTIHPTEPISGAVRTLRQEGIRRLLVVDRDGILVGVVARRDLLTPFTRPDTDIQHDIESRLAAYRADTLNFPPVSVHVTNGESTLDGAVLLRSTAELVHHLAATVPGVVAMHNNLTYEIGD